MLEISELVSGYLGAPVVHGVSFSVAKGELFCLLGANGAGKSTIAKTAAGVITARGGWVRIDDMDVTNFKAFKRVRAGLSLVPEARNLFVKLSVLDNLVLGAYTRKKAERGEATDRVMELLPQLAKLTKARAGDLSGGEQQMLAIGRALMADPHYLILDEPSLGLAPLIVDTILEKAQSLAAAGVGVLLIEQNVDKALAISSRAAVVENGRITLSGSAAEIRNDPRLVASYLGAVE